MLTEIAFTAGAIWLFTKDRDDGLYVAEAHPFDRPSHAIVSRDLDVLTSMPSWLAELLADPVDLRIQGTGGTDGDGLFIGIGPTSDVDCYLSGVAHDRPITATSSAIRNASPSRQYEVRRNR